MSYKNFHRYKKKMANGGPTDPPKKDSIKSFPVPINVDKAYRSITPIGYSPIQAGKEYLAGERLPFTWNGVPTSWDTFQEHPMFKENLEQGQYIKDASDAAWKAYVYGMNTKDPEIGNIYSKSKYRPTKAKDKNAKYYSLNNIDDIFDDAVHNKLTDKDTKTGTEVKVKDSAAGGFTLSNYKLSKGKDDKGNYISYYDKNDYNINMGPMSIKGENILGNPFEVYGRIYYDPKTLQIIDDDKVDRVMRNVPAGRMKALGGPGDPPFKTPTYEDSLYLYQRSLPQNFYARFPEEIEDRGQYGLSKYKHYGLMSREQAEQLTKSIRIGGGNAWSPFVDDKVSYDAPEIIQKYNPAPENDEFATDEWRTGSNWDLPYFETVEKAPIKPIGYDVVGWRQFLEGDTHNRRRSTYINGTLAESSSREWQDEGRWGTEDEYGSWRVQARYPKPTGKPTPERSASSLTRQAKRDALTQEMKDAGFTGYKAREVLKPGSEAAKAWEEFQNKESNPPTIKRKKGFSPQVVNAESPQIKESVSDVDYKRYGKDKKPITDIPESGQIFVTSKDDPLYKEYAQRRKLYKESEKGWNLERDKWYKKEIRRSDSFIEAAEGNLEILKDSKADFDSEEDYQKLLKEQEDKIIKTKGWKEEALKKIKEQDYLSEMKSRKLDFEAELFQLEDYEGAESHGLIDYSTGTEINEDKVDYLKDLNKSKYRPVLMYGPAESGYTVGWDKPKLRVTYRDPSEFTKTQLNEFIKSDDKQDWGKVKNLLNIPENDVSDNYNPKIDGPFPSRTKKEPTYPKSAPEGYTLIKGYKAGDGKWYGNKYVNAEGDEIPAGPTKEEGIRKETSGLLKKQYGGPIGSISTETWPLIDEVTKNLAKSEENKQFLISMANSPLFGERYKRMSGNPDLTDKEIESYRQDIINNLNTARPIHQNLETLEQRGAAGYYRPRTKEAVIATSPKDSTQEFLKKKEEQYNKWFPNQSHSINLPFADDFSPSAHTHELSHASTIGDLDLRAKDEPIARFARGEDAHIGNYAEGTFLETPYKELFPNLEEKREGYLTDKSEQKSRKDALAKHLQDRGIYDPVNETFNENHYNALVQDYFKLGMKKDREAVKKAFDEDPYIYFQMGDILKNYNKENVINMFNDFVQNENQEQGLPMAAYGGPIAKYYHGGFPHDPPIYDFTKTVEENAERGVDTSGKSVAVKTSLPQYNTATEVGDFANKMSRAKWEIEKDHINVPGKRGYEDGRYVHKDEMTAQDWENVQYEKNRNAHGVTPSKLGYVPEIISEVGHELFEAGTFLGGKWFTDWLKNQKTGAGSYWDEDKKMYVDQSKPLIPEAFWESGVAPFNSHLDNWVRDEFLPRQTFPSQIGHGGRDKGFITPREYAGLMSMAVPFGGSGTGNVIKQGFTSLGDDIYRGVPKSLKTTHTNIGQDLVISDLPKSRLARRIANPLKESDELPFGFNKEQYLQDKAAKEANIAKHGEWKPYLKSREAAKTREQDILESFYGNERFKQAKEARTTSFDKDGNIIPKEGFRSGDIAKGETLGFASYNYPYQPTTKVAGMDVIVGKPKKIIPETSGRIGINKKIKGSDQVKSTLDHEYDHLASPMFRSVSGRSLIGDMVEKNYPTLDLIPDEGVPGLAKNIGREMTDPFINFYGNLKEAGIEVGDLFKKLKSKSSGKINYRGQKYKVSKDGKLEIDVPERIKSEVTKPSRDKIKNWLDTDEYVRRRQKTTGETVEQIKKDVEIVKKELDESKVTFEKIYDDNPIDTPAKAIDYVGEPIEQQVRLNQANKDIWSKLKTEPRKLTEKEVKNAFNDSKSYNFEFDTKQLINLYAKKLLGRKAKNPSTGSYLEQIKKFPKLYDKYIKEYTKTLNEAWVASGVVGTGALGATAIEGTDKKALGGPINPPASQYKRLYGHAKDYGVGTTRGLIDSNTGYKYFPEEGQGDFISNQESAVPENPWNLSRFSFQPFMAGEKQGVHNAIYGPEGNYLGIKELYPEGAKNMRQSMRQGLSLAKDDLSTYYTQDLGLSKKDASSKLRSDVQKLKQMKSAQNKMGSYYFKDFQDPDFIFDESLGYQTKFSPFASKEEVKSEKQGTANPTVVEEMQHERLSPGKTKRAYTKFQKTWGDVSGKDARKLSRAELKEAKERKEDYIKSMTDHYNLSVSDYKKEIKNIQKNKGSMDYYYGGPVIWATGNRDERISHQKQLPPQNQKTISSTFGLTGTPYDVNYYNTDLSKPIDYNAAKPMPYTGNRDLRLRALKRGMGGTVNENQMDTMNQYEQGKNTVVGAMGAIPGWGQAVQGFSALGKAGNKLSEGVGVDTNIFDPFGNIVENLSSDKTSQQKAGNIVKNLVTGGLSGDDNLFGFFAYGGQPDYPKMGDYYPDSIKYGMMSAINRAQNKNLNTYGFSTIVKDPKQPYLDIDVHGIGAQYRRPIGNSGVSIGPDAGLNAVNVKAGGQSVYKGVRPTIGAGVKFKFGEGGPLDLSPNEGNSQYEAEGGEIVIGGMPEVYNGGNLKQNSENAFKIEGNSHENGGVDMSGGDYIFSDRIYLDDDILNELDL